MVWPILEYASNVWSPHCDKDEQCMEAAQRRAARFNVNHYSRYLSVTSMMQKLDWPTLKEYRKWSKLVIMYKVVHGHVHIQSILPIVPKMVLPEAITINFCSQQLGQMFINIHSFHLLSNYGTLCQMNCSVQRLSMNLRTYYSYSQFVAT